MTAIAEGSTSARSGRGSGAWACQHETASAATARQNGVRVRVADPEPQNSLKPPHSSHPLVAAGGSEGRTTSSTRRCRTVVPCTIFASRSRSARFESAGNPDPPIGPAIVAACPALSSNESPSSRESAADVRASAAPACASPTCSNCLRTELPSRKCSPIIPRSSAMIFSPPSRTRPCRPATRWSASHEVRGRQPASPAAVQVP